MAEREGQCAFCGEHTTVTDDHVPPQGLFYSAQGEDELIQVPGCGKCNEGASDDDEYFRDVTVSREESFAHPRSHVIRRKVARSLNRPQAKGKRRGFEKSIVAYRRPGVLGAHHISDVGAIEAEIDRLVRTARKIIRGLYYYEEGHPLPNPKDAEVFAFHDQQFGYNQPREIICWLDSSPWRVKREGVFSYRYRVAEDNPALSLWQFRFFSTPRTTGPEWVGCTFEDTYQALRDAFGR